MEQINYAAHGDQRVAVFIDTQNLYHSAKANFRSNVNYFELMEKAVNGRKLIRAFAYVIKSEENTEEKFFDVIEEIGIEIRVKDLQVFHTGAKKADWDVGIAVDMIRLTEKVDVVVLASGDGDFIEVVRYCKSRGVRVEVMAFEKNTNARLMEEVDNFVDLGDRNADFLINNKRRPTSNRIENEGNDGYESRVIKPKTDLNYAKTVPENIEMKEEKALYKTKGLYSGSNLSAVNRLESKDSKVDPRIYGNNPRKIKPVVGLPAKPEKPLYGGKTLINDLTKKNGSVDNAFGNKPSVLPKKNFF